MPKKFEDLESLIVDIKRTDYKNQITLDRLKYHIAKKFGYSSYIIRSTLQALKEFGFIREISIGTFEFINEETAKRDEKEVDKLLNEKVKK